MTKHFKVGEVVALVEDYTGLWEIGVVICTDCNLDDCVHIQIASNPDEIWYLEGTGGIFKIGEL